MIWSFLKIALRTLLRFKEYAAINILGLALGLTSGILILIYVLDEISYDKFHAKADRIYRVGTDLVDINSGNLNSALERNGWPVGALLKKDFPEEIEKVVYMMDASYLEINHNGKVFEERIFFAGDDFFEIFSFPLIKGNPATALAGPNSIVLTESMEKKYFNGDALGKTMTFADTLSFVVTGVMKDTRQSHLQFDILVSFITYGILDPFSYDAGWAELSVHNYVVLSEGADKKNFFRNARNLYMNYVQEDMKKRGTLMYVGFEPLSEVYLYTKRGNRMGPLGSIDRVYIVSGIAIFVILLACINFVNLATARSTYRAKEVGLRKMVGSTRSSLMRQFLGESFLLTALSFVLAIVLIALLLPLFNQLLDKNYSLISLTDPGKILGMILLVAGITLLSGYYPALVMSSMRPSEVLKGSLKNSPRGIQFRRALVVFQFIVSAVLIICALVMVKQLNFMQNRDLGFSGKQVLVLDLDRVTDRGGRGPSESTIGFKNELQYLSPIESVTFTNALPGRPGWVGQRAFPADRPEAGKISVEYMVIDENYIKTLRLAIIAGRNFELDQPSELLDGLIINETCVQKMGWGTPENAIGKRIDSPSKHPSGKVIGVVKDYHELGLQQQINSMTMVYNPSRANYFAIRFKTTGTSDLLSDLQKLWKKYYEGYDFKYFFLDANFARQYQAEQQLARVFTVFSVVTIVIAIIGLVGLVSFMVVSRTKEIGIRKILGANVLNITRLLSREFMLLVILANLIACPLAWYLTSQWLEKFAFRTTPGFGLFVLTFIIAIAATIFTVSFQTIRAAMADPVKALRYE